MSPARPRRMPGSFASAWISPTTGATSRAGPPNPAGARSRVSLEDALSTILRVPAAPLTVAGRTDAGVHATGQVAHLDVPAAAGPSSARPCCAGSAGCCRPTCGSRAVEAVSPDFDARFSALWRRYVYRASDHPGGVDPLRRHDTLAWARPLDVAAMAAAAQTAARRARLRRVLPPPRGGHVDPHPAGPRRRAHGGGHRVAGAGRRVLLLDGALTRRRAARRRGRAARAVVAGLEAGADACGPTMCPWRRRTGSRWSRLATRRRTNWRLGSTSLVAVGTVRCCRLWDDPTAPSSHDLVVRRAASRLARCRASGGWPGGSAVSGSRASAAIRSTGPGERWWPGPVRARWPRS